MQFTPTAKKAPVAQAGVISDAEFVAKMTVLDEMLEEGIESLDAVKDEKVEIAASFKTLDVMIKEGLISDESLQAMALTTPGLKELFTDMQSFKGKVAEQAKAMEGFLDGMLGDANTGLIGAIIAFARNNLPSVKEQIDICKQKLAATSDAKVEERSNQMFIRVRSKYLPSVQTFQGAVKALNTCLATVASNPKASWDQIIKGLRGSMYDNGKGGAKGQQDTDWKYAGVRLLPTLLNMVPGAGIVGAGVQVAERFWYDRSKPVGERGWNKKQIYADGLKQLEALVGNLAKALGAVSKSKAEQKDLASAAQFCKWAEKEVVYLGRGLTTAIRKVYAGGVVRFFSNRFIH